MQRVLSEPARLGEGRGLRFRTVVEGVERDAFVVRYRGRVHAYVNACRHLALPLDFGDARFFDEAYDAIVCCQHGARYRPDTGVCFAGPCAGARLTPLLAEERPDGIWCGAAPR